MLSPCVAMICRKRLIDHKCNTQESDFLTPAYDSFIGGVDLFDDLCKDLCDDLCADLVPLCGIEPQPSEPESEILSIKLRGLVLQI